MTAIPRPARQGERGITLVEVLLSVVICATGLVIAAQGIASSLRVEVAAQNLEKAAVLGREVLADLESGLLPLAAASGDGADRGAPEYSFDIDLDNGEVEGLVKATVIVTWTERGTENRFEVVRLFYQDPDAQAATSAASGGRGG